LVITASVYLFYSKYHHTDFYRRLRDEGLSLYDQYSTLKSNHDDSVFKSLRNFNQHRNSFYQEQLALLDQNKNVLYKEPDTSNFQLPPELLKNLPVVTEAEYRFWNEERNGVIIFLDNKYYVIVSAVDKSGIERLATLRLLLIGVFLGGLILTAFLSFFFVRSAFKPLANLSMQMQQTTESNLTARVSESTGNDEVQQIAHSFNGMLERLNQSFESQKSFVHHASHELRTPLATMLSQTEIALSKDLSHEEYRKLLESLKEDQVGMVELTNSLLLLSQYEKIKSYSKWPMLRIDEVLYETIGSARKMLSGIELELEFANIPEDENGLMIQGNDALLKVAFTNLIKNAWQYSTDKKVFVTIDVVANQINVYFENNGKHLTASETDKLKVPFFRGSNSANVKGFGLGLSIVQRIITLHNGNFAYTAIKPSINRFTIYFKQKQA